MRERSWSALRSAEFLSSRLAVQGVAQTRVSSLRRRTRARGSCELLACVSSRSRDPRRVLRALPAGLGARGCLGEIGRSFLAGLGVGT